MWRKAAIPCSSGAGRFAAVAAGSQMFERAALLLFDDDGLQIGDPLLQLPDDEILLAEAIRDAGVPQLIAGAFAEIAEQHADEDDQDYACPHGHN